MKFGGKKIDILVKKRQEDHFQRESEQGVLQEGYRARPLEFGFESLR